MATTITADEVKKQFGDFYIDAGQNENDISTKLKKQFETMNAFTVVRSDDTVLRKSNTEMSSVLQQFQKKWTPKGSLAFTPAEIPLRQVKVDLEFYPDDLIPSWLQFLASNSLDYTSWPFIRWVIENWAIPQIQEDLEDSIFNAKYVAPTEGSAGDTLGIFDGTKKIINDGITDSIITPIVTGALETDNKAFIEQIESFVDSINPLYRRKGLDINLSDTLLTRAIRGQREKYNTYYAQENTLTKITDAPNVNLAGYLSQEGSNKIWATPKLNAILGFKADKNQTLFQIQTDARLVKIFSQFYVGTGFIDKSVIFTNDQELPTT